jgi:transposase-like protein
VLEKVSKADLDQVKKDYWSIFNGIEAPPGEEAVTVAQERATQFAEKYASRYPRAMDCLLDNLSALTAHLQFPVEQRERIRHTDESFKARVALPAGWDGVSLLGGRGRPRSEEQGLGAGSPAAQLAP